MGLAKLTQSHAWKNFMAKLYGIGASVVIIGALFKIMHWPFAGPMLIAGLGTEAIIFFFSAFEPLHEEIDWTLVYPQLSGLVEDDEIEILPNNTGSSNSGEALAKFDEMLDKAGGANLFDKLGNGIETLNDRVKDLNNISDAALATNEFTDNVKNASNSVNELSTAYKSSAAEVSLSVNNLSEAYKQSAESLNYSVENLSDAYTKSAQNVTEKGGNFIAAYERLTESMEVDFSALKDGNSKYGAQVGILNKNLTALNAIFELQLNEADLDKMMEDLNGSVEQSRKYHTEIKKLGKRLESLNNVYGNMLAAMNINVGE
ncbi:MAG: gliding motility protein GldL [Bacteroidales bacterium]|nr:gliding motility protein GldL [Bacteroidales bacterium]MBN2755888.1 gliding motility protein GldL [Bacteroidales bacterium]